MKKQTMLGLSRKLLAVGFLLGVGSASAYQVGIFTTTDTTKEAPKTTKK